MDFYRGIKARVVRISANLLIYGFTEDGIPE